MPKIKSQEKALLESPVCVKIPGWPPILQYTLVCNSCHSIMKNCLLSNCPLGKFRHRIAEAHIPKTPTKCQFVGCTMELTKNELVEHQTVCQHRMAWCISPTCRQQFSFANLTNHVTKDHQVVESNFYGRMERPYPIVHYVFDEHHFYFVHFCNEDSTMWFFIVYLMGPQRDAANYSWYLEIGLPPGKSMTYTGTVASIDLIKDLKRMSFLRLRVPADVVNQFIVNDDISLFLSIRKVE